MVNGVPRIEAWDHQLPDMDIIANFHGTIPT